MKPRSPYSFCSASSFSYCGASPQREATFTISSTLPEYSASEVEAPSMVVRGISEIEVILKPYARISGRQTCSHGDPGCATGGAAQAEGTVSRCPRVPCRRARTRCSASPRRASQEELSARSAGRCGRRTRTSGATTQRFIAVQARVGADRHGGRSRAVRPRPSPIGAEHRAPFTGAAGGRARPDSTRRAARTFGHPGGWRRERYLDLLREWVGLGEVDPRPVRPGPRPRAPREIRHLLADALAEEATARRLAALGIGYTVWHDVAAGGSRGEDRPRRARPDRAVRDPVGGLRRPVSGCAAAS